MPPKKKKVEDSPPKELLQNDAVISALKSKYFDLLKKEKIPNTPELTKEIDNIENAIKALKGK